MTLNLSGKKILLFSPDFFGYGLAIKEALESKNANVYYFNERPDNNFLTKVLIRMGLDFIIYRKIYSYYLSRVSLVEDEKIDYLFLIDPETIKCEFILEIKKRWPGLKVIIYMWDSIKNRKNALKIFPVSDKIFTFDPYDLIFNEKIQFLPLFYLDKYKNIANAHVGNYKYDLAFIGTLHSDRYKIAKKTIKLAKSKGLKTYCFFYSPSKILFFFQSLLFSNFRSVDKKYVSFIPMKEEEFYNTVLNSKILMDVHHPGQEGLTMRAIESLGAKRKLLTTNYKIKNYDFYNISNIHIFNINSMDINNIFFNLEYEDVDSEIYKKYSIDSWLATIFNN